MDSTSPPPTIVISNASLRYNNTLLFDQLNCTIPAGCCTCLLGPSGVGKTSLLRMIAGLDKKHYVQATIVASDRQPLHGRIAYMAQTDLLLPWLSVRNNVLLGFSLRGQRPTKANRLQADHLLEEVGLKAVINQYPQALSIGMRQRAALVRALMENKPIVMMDEPFAAVDTITRMQLQDLTAKLLVNRTVLLVTHDPLEALRLGHRIHVMSGQPARLDKPLELAGQPPRGAGDPELLIYQAELLRRLSKAKEIS